ncbi:E3 ubiquitin-protein ligase At3g02290-like [Prosopis cineraria]|uniref:E3 ubiquitin-protein ligase At3g02290-like n=1 Tax=Prosopis cineraria TaxID=364024 RepID=UPI00240EF28F|nr:E3 ubiquitin-protein ligase At3g02290-like [Prosopis cineraria]
MSSNNNNSAPSSGSWRTGVRFSGYHIPTNRDSFEVPASSQSPSTRTTPRQMTPSPLNPLWYMADRRQAGLYSIPESDSYEVPVFYQASSRHATPDERTSNVVNHLQFLEDSFPAQPDILNGDTGRGFNRRLRETHQASVPPRRSTRQSNAQAPTAPENPRCRALSKLRKEIYEPNIPTSKMLAKKLSFYYRDNKGVNALKEMENKQKNEDRKSCAVCLEDFVPKQEVMVTPCKHMFHEDCIMPWLRSQGQCPICRFVICEKERENDVGTSYLIAGDLLSIVRAMEEAFRLDPETL